MTFLFFSEVERRAYEQAEKFARDAHAGQVRRFTGEEYINHPVRVAQAVSRLSSRTIEMVQAAVLHDVLEDTNALVGDLMVFGRDVTFMVQDLTDQYHGTVPTGNRYQRKKAYSMKLEASWPQVKTIKMLDIMDNLPSLMENASNFGVVYLREKIQLFPSLKGGHNRTYSDLAHMLSFYARRVA